MQDYAKSFNIQASMNNSLIGDDITETSANVHSALIAIVEIFGSDTLEGIEFSYLGQKGFHLLLQPLADAIRFELHQRQ